MAHQQSQAPLGNLELLAKDDKAEALDASAVTPPPPPIDGFPAWAIQEKHTFLNVQAPSRPPLLRVRTDPTGAPAVEASDSEDETSAGPPPPPLTLEFFETEDCLWQPSEEDSSLFMVPPPLGLENFLTDDPFRPTPKAAGFSCDLAPPPLSLENFVTDDPFRPTPNAADLARGLPLEQFEVDMPFTPSAAQKLGLAAPPPLSLEYVATDDPFQPAGMPAPPPLMLDFAATDDPSFYRNGAPDLLPPPGLPPPPPPLELFESEDPFEKPLDLPQVHSSEPAFVPLPTRPAKCGPPPPPVAPAPFIGTPLPVLPPPPPPPAMPSMPAPDFVAPSPHEAPKATPGHNPGAGIAAVLATELRQSGLLVRPTTSAGCTHVHWTVDARKLEGQDKQAVSPVFSVELPGYGPTPFKLVLYPKATNDGKHGAGFKKAKGHGRVVLKCEAQLPENLADVSFRVGVGRPGPEKETLQPFRGPVSQNFFEHSCHGLLKSDEDWDFSASVDESRSFLVTVEITPTKILEANPGIWWSPLVDTAVSESSPADSPPPPATEATS